MRRLLAALAAVIAVGALLDATVHRDSVGQPTVRERDQREADEAGLPLERSVPTLVGRAAGPGRLDGRYSVYLAVRDAAPGAVVLIDERIRSSELDEVLLRTIAAAADVRTADLDGITLEASLPVPGEQPTGSDEFGPWIVRVAPGPVDTLLIVDDGGTRLLLDARLAPGPGVLIVNPPPLPAETVTSALPADQPPTLLRAVVVESVVLILLLLVGGLLLPRAAFGRTARVVLALPVGIAAHAALSLPRLPGLWGLVVTVGAACVVAAVLESRGNGRGVSVGWRRDDLGRLVLAGAGITGAVAWARWASFLTLTPDSRDYWAGGALLADGGLTVALLDVKRGLSQQSLHAVGFTLGIEGLQAMGLVLLLAGVVLLVLQGSRASGPSSATVLALLLGAAVLLSPQLRTMAAYLNGHMLVAVLLLVLVLLLGAGEDRERRAGLLPAVAAVLMALVITRAEGALLVGLVLLGTLGVRDERTPWRGAWAVLSVGTLAWAGMLAAGAVVGGDGVPPAIVLLAVVGATAGMLALVVDRVPARQRRRIPILAGTLLWVFALLIQRRDSVVFVDAAITNLGRGAGGWGVLAPLLLIAGIVAVRLTAGQDDLRTGPARWLVIGFIPMTMLVKLGDGFQSDGAELSALLSGGGRVGWGDSVNRMWTHVSLIVLLLVQRIRPRAPVARVRSELASAGRAAHGLVLLALAVWIALQWQPDGVPRTAVAEEFTLLSVAGDLPVGELVDGAEVRQQVTLPEPALPSGARPRTVCADVPLVTFARENTGAVVLELQAGSRSATRRIAADQLVDWGAERICVDLPTDPQDAAATLDDVVVTVRGSRAERGLAASALEAPGPTTTLGPSAGARFATVDGDGRAVEQRVGHLVVDVVLIADVEVGLLSDPLRRSTLVLPWLALLVGVGLEFTRREPRHRLTVR